jgi:hypothetical protein
MRVSRAGDQPLNCSPKTRREHEKIDWKFFHWLRLVNWKHAENGSEELDNGAVQHRDRRNKPDNQREDGQGIHVARLVCDKTPDSLNKHAAGLLNSA